MLEYRLGSNRKLVLVDSSIWIDHLKMPETFLSMLLEKGQVAVHPFIVGELAVGSLRQRDAFLQDLHDLPQLNAAYNEEVLRFINTHKLFGTGVGYVDAHLLVAVQLSGATVLWTRDKRLLAVAERLNLAWHEPKPS